MSWTGSFSQNDICLNWIFFLGVFREDDWNFHSCPGIDVIPTWRWTNVGAGMVSSRIRNLSQGLDLVESRTPAGKCGGVRASEQSECGWEELALQCLVGGGGRVARYIWRSLEGPRKTVIWEHLSGSSGEVAVPPPSISASLALGVLFLFWNSLKTRLCLSPNLPLSSPCPSIGAVAEWMEWCGCGVQLGKVDGR